MDGCGSVIWITGLSGSGKTTLACALLPLLPQPRLLLDGDRMRWALELLASGYGIEDRRRLALTYSRQCLLAAEQGAVVVCATISMFHEIQTWNRENLPNYFEVYLEIPEEIRLARDHKKVYEKGDASLSPVVGVHMKPELPLQPNLIVPYQDRDVCETSEMVYATWRRQFPAGAISDIR